MMGGFVNSVDIIGENAITDSIINRNIEEFSDDDITTLGIYALYGCTALTSVTLPLVADIGNYGFTNCTALITADFTAVKTIGKYAFERCSALIAFILRNNNVVATGSSGMFASTPIASGRGYIYVPSDRVNSYKAANKWNDYANQIRAIEDYTIDGTITGELDPTKI